MSEAPIFDQAAKDKLYAELPGKVELALKNGKPLLHHLNGDTTWLYQIPLNPIPNDTRRWFNILIDPWLVGWGTVGHRWVISMTHTILPAFSTVDEVGELCCAVDKLTAPGMLVNGRAELDIKPPQSPQKRIDLVLCTNPGPDHVNVETLITLDPSIPIGGAHESVHSIRRMQHFAYVHAIPQWDRDTESTLCLPDGLTVHELGPSPSNKWSSLEVAFYFEWQSPSDAQRQGMIHVPHGLLPAYDAPRESPSLGILALVAGTQYSTTGSALYSFLTNHGTDAGFATIARTGAQWYIATHDEDFTYTGVISYLVTRLADKDFEPAREDMEKNIRDEMDGDVGEERQKELGEQLSRVREAVCCRPGVGETIVPM